jgi:hypothetical protein
VKARSPEENQCSPLTELDWNFDAVPDGELIACIYWEYARESAFIHSVRQRCLDPKWREMLYAELQDYVGRDLGKIQSIGAPSNMILSGFFRPANEDLPAAPPPDPGEPPLPTGSFPTPWRSLPAQDRVARVRINSEREDSVPFQRGTTLDAENILVCASRQRAQADGDREMVRRENPKLTEEELVQSGKLKFLDLKPAVLQSWGREASVIAIDWGRFTNDEIVNYFRRWVKTNRPEEFPVPSKKGHKRKDLRAHLTCLSVLRLLSHFTPLELIDTRSNRCPAIWETKAFAGQKWLDAGKWYDARREAGKMFHLLFPFLPADEKPLSWVRQKPAK